MEFYFIVSSRSRSISPMKQVDTTKDKPKKPGAPTINGKDSLKPHNGISQLRNKAGSNPNLQYKSTSNLHYLKDEITLKQSTSNNSRINRIRSISSNNEAHKYNKRLPLPSTKFSSTSGISSVDTVSNSTSNSTTSKIGKNLNSRTKIIPPIPGGTLKTKQKDHDVLNNISPKGSKSSKAQTIKGNQPEYLSNVRKKTYTVAKSNLMPNRATEKEDEDEEVDDDDDDTLEQSEDDAKSNVTYKIR